MHRRTVGLLAALTLAALPAAQSTASTSTPSVHAACKRAVIVHKHKCIAKGQYCKHTRRANRDYHRYGYRCGKRDRNGAYHLVYY
jgi:curli biogenesis system outer membrane secretion channel CsgG